MSKLDVAIRELVFVEKRLIENAYSLELARAFTEVNQANAESQKEEARKIRSAIRVLEAAGKVDKNATIRFLDDTYDRDEKLYGEVGYTGTAQHKERAPLRALLAALPED